MRLYHHPFSSSSRRAVMAALHMNTPVELVTVQDIRDPELLRPNPNSKIPVMRDGDFVLWESCAIMQYFAEKSPGQTLYPTDLQQRADVNRWLFWAVAHWSPSLLPLVWENWMKGLYGGGGAPDPHEIQRGERETARVAAVLDGQLRGREWVCGGRLTLADFAIAPPLFAMEPARLPLLQYGNLQAWFGRIKSLDAWKRTDGTNPASA
jgi:glutathione S-transferase